VYEGVNTTWFTCRMCVWRSEYDMVHLSQVCMKEWIQHGSPVACMYEGVNTTRL